MFNTKLQVNLRGPAGIPMLNIMSFFKDPLWWMTTLKAYGNLVPIADRNGAMIIAYGTDNAKAVLSDDETYHHASKHLVRTPEGSAASKMFVGMPVMNGPAHKRHRRLLMPTMHRSALESYANTIRAAVRDLTADLTEGVPWDAQASILRVTLRTSIECLMGVHRDIGERIAKDVMRSHEGWSSPLLALFPYRIPGSPYARWLRHCEDVYKMLSELLEMKRSRQLPANDMMWLLTHSTDDQGEPLSDAEIIGEMNAFYAAGHETTAYTIAWTLFLLSQHPEVAVRLRDEVRSAGEKKPYLDAVVKESMRLFPAAALMIPREVKRVDALYTKDAPFELDRLDRISSVEGGHCGYMTSVPTGSYVVIPTIIEHRNERVYPNPLVFDPERWMVPSFKPALHEYMPFGAGARRCFGAPFADMQVRIVLTELLKRFSFSSAGGEVNTKFTSIVMSSKEGIWLTPTNGLPKKKRVWGGVRSLVDLQ